MASYHFHDDDGDTFSEYDLEQLYREMLDDVYGTVKVAGFEYDTSRALEALDPVAFRCGLADFTSEHAECFGADCDDYAA